MERGVREMGEMEQGLDRAPDSARPGLISHLKLMEEEVTERIIDTLLPLTCLPIKLISFGQFIS